MTDQCPPPVQEFDLSRAGDCRAILLGLFNAALALVSGNATTRIRMGERWTDFSRGDYAKLQELYTATYQSCKASGADLTGLPSLAPGDRQERGRPGRFFRNPWQHW